ncbi:MAG: ATP-binding protein [Bdellovibrionaceae bacterium]|nr:ATP-binding protein [Pseudobdellovibrionaceae bacterium]
MPTLRSSVLIVCHPQPDSVGFGADFAENFQVAAEMARAFPYQVVVLPSGSTHRADDADADLAFLDELNATAPLSQRVIIQMEAPPERLRRMINKGNAFKILANFQDAQFERTVLEALEEYNLIRQNAKLFSLVNEQNESLRKLTAELEERVEKRQKFLEDARRKVLATNHRVEALHRALVAVHRATSIAEMERLTTEALSGVLGLSWIRIFFRSQSLLDPKKLDPLPALFSAPLMRGKDELGSIYFARDKGSEFTKDETGFLSQIADAVSLSIGRLTKLEQSETLKHQWEATFDAILDPVCLIDDNYSIQRINRSFAERSGSEPERLIGRKCHEAFFGRKTPCENCSMGSNFRLKPARTAGGDNVIYDVFSQEIRFKPADALLYMNMYHDVSAQLRLERQILESAKMAELGVIGSSIAHELNNPLGGMLSFLQLIRMDLKGDESFHGDIIEMERAALRCRDIVKSLLGFTRKSSSDDPRQVDLREAIEQALKITELQTRAMGIQVHLDLPPDPALITGQFNFLAQSIRNLLQNAQEAIAEKLKSRPGARGEIHIRLTSESASSQEGYVIEVRDNGTGFDPHLKEQVLDPLYTTKDPSRNPGLGLTVALQIIRDHSGDLEISSSPDSGTSVKIRLPRLESSQTKSDLAR